MLPEKVQIGAHWYEIIETDDTGLLDGDNYGYWRATKQEIYIKKSVSSSRRAEAFLHEISEIILRSMLNVKERDYTHQEHNAFIEMLTATLLSNKINLLEIGYAKEV